MPATSFRPRRDLVGKIAATACFLGGFGSLTLAGAGHKPAAVPARPDGTPAIRSTVPWVRDLVATGVDRSPTFAAEVRELTTSDVVVFVEPVHTLPGTLRGYLVLMSATPGIRYVRVRFDMHLPQPRAIAVLGHELQHAVEVARHPEVIDAATLAAMYQRSGRETGRDTYDSIEAVNAGDLVLQEYEGR